MNEPVFSPFFCDTRFRIALTQILTLFCLAAIHGLVFIVFSQADSGHLMFSEPMDSCFWPSINSERFFAHLFNASHGCECILGIAFIFTSTDVMLADNARGQNSRIMMVLLLLFASTVVMTYTVALAGI